MASENNKKLLLIYVLEILKEHSDGDNPLTQQEIIDKINLVYNMKVERKAISSNIENLRSLGFDIQQINRKGYFLGQREFEPSEVQFLVDAVFSSRVISAKQSIDLSKKLYSFLSKYQRKKYNYIYKSESLLKSNNKQIFYNIELINEAIEKKKQISFTYNEYDINQNLVPRKNVKVYVVNPYFMVNSQGKYYLVCNYNAFDEIANYKMDLITDIKILDRQVKPVNKLKGYEKGLDVTKYVNQNIYMFGSEVITAEVELLNPNYTISILKEWFGKNATIKKENNKTFATIISNEKALVYWCLQYGEHIKLLSPEQTKTQLQKQIEILRKNYID